MSAAYTPTAQDAKVRDLANASLRRFFEANNPDGTPFEMPFFWICYDVFPYITGYRLSEDGRRVEVANYAIDRTNTVRTSDLSVVESTFLRPSTRRADGRLWVSAGCLQYRDGLATRERRCYLRKRREVVYDEAGRPDGEEEVVRVYDEDLGQYLQWAACLMNDATPRTIIHTTLMLQKEDGTHVVDRRDIDMKRLDAPPAAFFLE